MTPTTDKYSGELWRQFEDKEGNRHQATAERIEQANMTGTIKPRDEAKYTARDKELAILFGR